MNRDLKLPIMKGRGPKDRHLSMDNYLKFVIFNLRHIVDMKAGRRLKREMLAGKPFRFQ
jgi:hypothetical protein